MQNITDKNTDYFDVDYKKEHFEELKVGKIFYNQFIYKCFSFTFTPFDWGIGFTFGYTDHWGFGLFVGPFYLSIDL